QLGITDPDAERLAAEQEMRRSQGVAGEWQVVSTAPTSQTSQSPELEDEKDVKPDIEGSAVVGEKRPADDEDAHGFKIRKKRLNTGLGEIYDPGLIPIKVKKKEEPKESSLPPAPEASTSQSASQPSEERPKWAPLSLKPRAEGSTSTPTS